MKTSKFTSLALAGAMMFAAGAAGAAAVTTTWTTKNITVGTTTSDGGTYGGVSFNLSSDDWLTSSTFTYGASKNYTLTNLALTIQGRSGQSWTDGLKLAVRDLTANSGDTVYSAMSTTYSTGENQLKTWSGFVDVNTKAFVFNPSHRYVFSFVTASTKLNGTTLAGGQFSTQQLAAYLNATVATSQTANGLINGNTATVAYDEYKPYLSITGDLTEVVPEDKGTLRAYVLTGQSNSLGAVKGSPLSEEKLDSHATTMDDVIYWHENFQKEGDVYAGASTSWERVAPAAPATSAYSGNPCMGPEYGFAWMLTQKGMTQIAGDDDLGIIKASLDGGGNGYWEEGNNGWSKIIAAAGRAVNAALADGYSEVKFVGVIYLQGESNSEAEAAVAGTRITALRDRFKTALGAISEKVTFSDDFHIAIGEPANWTLDGSVKNPWDTTTRDNLYSAAMATDESGKTFGTWTPTRDLAKITSGDTMGVHYDGQSQLTIGARYAYAEAIRAGYTETEAIRSGDYAATLDSAGAYWSGATPGAGETVTWDVSSAARSTVGAGGVTFYGMEFDSDGGNYFQTGATLIDGSGTLTLGAGGITANKNVTITAPVVVSVDQTWNVAAGCTLTLSNVTYSDGATLTKTGAGTINILNEPKIFTVVKRNNTATYHDDLAYATYTEVDAQGTAVPGGITIANNWNDAAPNAMTYVANTTTGFNTLWFRTGSLFTSDAQPKYIFVPLTFAGLIVDADAEADGITSSGNSNRTINFGKSGLNSSTTINKDFAISNSGSTHADNTIAIAGTQGWTIAADKTFSLTTASGKQITQAGALEIKGGGTAAFNSATTVNGALTVTSKAKFAGALTTGADAAITVAATGSLELAAATTVAGAVTTEAGATLTLGAASTSAAGLTVSGTATISAGTVYNLAGAPAAGLKLVGGLPADYDASGMGAANIKVNGEAIDSRDTVKFTADGGVLTITEYTPFSDTTKIWAGGESGAWRVGGSGWTTSDGAAAQFNDGDTVIFPENGANETVTLAMAAPTTGGITVKGDYTFATSVAGGSTLTASQITATAGSKVAVDTGVTMDYGSQSSLTATLYGSGTAKVVATGGHGSRVNLGAGFTGTLDYTGKFNYAETLVNSDNISKVVLSSASGETSTMWYGGGATTFKKDIHFKTNYQIGDSAWTSSGIGCTVNFAGSVTAESGTTLTVSSLNQNRKVQVTFEGAKVQLATLLAENNNAKVFLNPKEASSIDMVSLKANATAEQKGGTISIRQVRIHDSNASSSESYTVSGGVLNVTGNGTGNQSAILIGHWPGSGNHKFVVTGGVVNVPNGQIQAAWDSAGAVEISGGEVNAKTYTGKNTGTTSITGGRLNIGTGGITAPNVTVNGGTIGTLANWTTQQGITVGANGATFDTATHTISESGASTESGAGSTVTIASAISGAGALVKAGAGTLLFKGDNTYTGTTTINGGVVQLGNGKGQSTGKFGAGDVTVADGAGVAFYRDPLEVANNFTFGNNSTLETIDVGGDGSTKRVGLTISGTATLGGVLLYKSQYDVQAVLSGKITGEGSIEFGGSADGTYGNNAVLTLTNAANDFTGGIKVSRANNAELRVTNAGALGAGGVNLENATSHLNYVGTAGEEESAYAGAITGAGAVKVISGNLALTSTASNFSGAMRAEGGRLSRTYTGGECPNTLAFRAGATMELTATTKNLWGIKISNAAGDTAGTLVLVGGKDFVVQNETALVGSTVTISGEATSFYGYQTMTLNGVTMSGEGKFNLNNGDGVCAVTVAGEGDSAIANVITGAGSITKTGAGTLTLSGENDYTGGTTVSAGKLTSGNVGALGNGAVTVAAGATLNCANEAEASGRFLAGTSFTINGAVTKGDVAIAYTIKSDGLYLVSEEQGGKIVVPVDGEEIHVTAGTTADDVKIVTPDGADPEAEPYDITEFVEFEITSANVVSVGGVKEEARPNVAMMAMPSEGAAFTLANAKPGLWYSVVISPDTAFTTTTSTTAVQATAAGLEPLAVGEGDLPVSATDAARYYKIKVATKSDD